MPYVRFVALSLEMYRRREQEQQAEQQAAEEQQRWQELEALRVNRSGH